MNGTAGTNGQRLRRRAFLGIPVAAAAATLLEVRAEPAAAVAVSAEWSTRFRMCHDYSQ